MTTWTDSAGVRRPYLGQPFATPTGPHAFIQWKGTDVCMDVRCACGDGFHIDGDFAHFVRCHHCNRVYQMDWHIRMEECDPADAYIPPLSEDDA